MRSHYFRLGTAGVLTVLALLAIPAYRHYAPVTAATDWQTVVYLDGIDRVSALAFDQQQRLYISQEHKNGKGRLLVMDPDGNRTLLVDGLSKPDGLIAYADGMAYSQEQGLQPVTWTDGSRFAPLFEGDSIEGMATDGHYLYAIEDLHHTGRLLRFDPATRNLTVLRRDLDEAEAVSVCPDGRIFYAEKTSGRITRLLLDGQDETFAVDLNQPGMLMCDELGLWVTEDATHMARVLRFDEEGNRQVILSHLRSPQTILGQSRGRYLVAEQGRNRVLQLFNNPVSQTDPLP